MARTSFVDVALRLRGARRFNAEVAAATKQLEAMGVKGAASMGAFAQKAETLKSAGRSLTMGLTLPIVGAGVVAGKLAMDFSDAMNQIETQAGVGAAEVGRMERAILAYAESGLSDAGPRELAAGMYRVASAGLRGAKAIDAMRTAEELATVGRIDMETASTALSSAVMAGIKGTENFRSAAGALNATVGVGNMRMDDLVSALGTGVASSAKIAGVNLSQLGAMIGTLTAQGIPATKAATGIRMTLLKLADPTDTASEALERLGLQPLQLAEVIQKGNLPGALGLLKSRLDGLSKVEQNQALAQIFSAKSAATIVPLLNDLDGFEKKLGQVNRGIGKFGELNASAMEEPRQKFNAALAQLEAIAIRFGAVVLPVVADTIKDLAPIVTAIAKGFQSLPKPIRQVVGGFILLAAVLGPLIWTVGVFAKGFGAFLIVGAKILPMLSSLRAAMFALNLTFLANPIVLAVVALVALGAALVLAYHKVGWFRTAVDAAFSFLKKGVVAVIGFVKSNWKLIVIALTGPLGVAVALVIKHWSTIKGAATAVVSWVIGRFKAMVNFFKGLPGAIAGAVSGAFDGIKDAFRSAINFIISAWNGLDLSLSILGKTVTIGTPNIPALADGGTVTRPGMALVGERGPELLSLPQAASVIPLGNNSNARIEVPVYLNGRQIALAVAGEVADARARS